MALTSFRRCAPPLLMVLVIALSLVVAFMSQASVTPAFGYASLLKDVLLFGCLPQMLLLGALYSLCARTLLLVSFGAVALSWLAVAELAARIFAA